MSGREELVAEYFVEGGAVAGVWGEKLGDEVPCRTADVGRYEELVGGDPHVGFLQRRRLERRLSDQHGVPDKRQGDKGWISIYDVIIGTSQINQDIKTISND